MYRLAGYLKVCSLSLYFVPRDAQAPIMRLPFNATTSLQRWAFQPVCGGARHFPDTSNPEHAVWGKSPNECAADGMQLPSVAS